MVSLRPTLTGGILKPRGRLPMLPVSGYRIFRHKLTKLMLTVYGL